MTNITEEIPEGIAKDPSSEGNGLDPGRPDEIILLNQHEPPTQQEPTTQHELPIQHEPPTQHHQHQSPTQSSKTSPKPDFRSILLEVSPLPSCSERRLTTRKRKAERSEVLTSTPIKNMLIDKKNEEKKKEEAKQARKEIRFEKDKSRRKEKLPKSKNKEKSQRPLKEKLIDYDNPKPETSTSTVDCIVCGDSYDENWIQCKTCEGWAHELCADIDDPIFYYCDYCKLNNK